MNYFSHDVLIPRQTVPLGPLLTWRDPGRLCDSPKSAIRSLQVIELLVESRRPLRAIEIVRALRLSPSSANQLLKTMMDWGYLVFDQFSKRYHLSPRLSKLGAQIASAYFAPSALDRLMEAIARALNLSVTISVCQGTYMQIVDHLPLYDRHPHTAQGSVKPNVVGMHVPLFGSSTGAAWLSCQNESTIRTLIHLCRRELARQSIHIAAIIPRLMEIKEQGYAFGGMIIDDSTRSLAVALPPNANGIVLVMAVYGATGEMEARRKEIARVSKELIGLHLRMDRGSESLLERGERNNGEFGRREAYHQIE